VYLVEIDPELCSGCGQCVEACPAQILGLGEDGKAEVSGDPTECLGCESCTVICEQGAVKVQEY